MSSDFNLGVVAMAHAAVCVVGAFVGALSHLLLVGTFGLNPNFVPAPAAIGIGVGLVLLVVLWALIASELSGEPLPKSPQLSALRKVIDEELRKPASEWEWRGRTDRCISPSGALVLWSGRSDTFNRHDLDEKVMTWAMRRARGKILKDISALRKGDKFGEMLLGDKNG